MERLNCGEGGSLKVTPKRRDAHSCTFKMIEREVSHITTLVSGMRKFALLLYLIRENHSVQEVPVHWKEITVS